MAVCVAVLGKENSPKFFSCLNPDTELQFQYKVHTALDFIDEKLVAIAKSQTNETRELYLGLLYSTEEYKLYGYVTNTRIKFVIAVDVANLLLRDNEIRTMFRVLHNAYADAICNPFYVLGRNIRSTVNGALRPPLLESNEFAARLKERAHKIRLRYVS